MTVTLRDYQRAAVDAVKREWAHHRSTLLVLATGLGKSVCCSHLLRDRQSVGRSLVLVHREELLQQMRGHLERVGLSVEIERAEEAALALSLTPSDCVVATVQTLKGRRLERWPREVFSQIVIDEAHRAAAPSYRAVLDHFYCAKVLGLTATPTRGDGVGLGEVFETCAHEMGIGQGIREGWLVPLVARTYPLESVDLRNVSMSGGDLSGPELDNEIVQAVYGIAQRLVERAGDRPTLAFLPGVASARGLATALATLDGVDPDRVASVDGKTTPDERQRITRGFLDGSIQYVANCMLWTEGFDAPPTACIALCRPTKSMGLLSQQIGRGTRTLPGTVDGLATAGERRAAIAASAKPDTLLVEFTGRYRIDLAHPAEVLAGEPLPEEAVKEARDATTHETEDGEAKTLEEVLEEALEFAEAAEAERALAQRRVRVKAVVQYATHPVELVFAPEHLDLVEATKKAVRETSKRDHKTCKGSGVTKAGHKCKRCRGTGKVRGNEWHDKGASQAERDYLARWGVKLPASANERQTAAAVTLVKARGLPSLAQVKTLRRFGLRTDVQKADAGKAMSALRDADWKATPEIVAEYG